MIRLHRLMILIASAGTLLLLAGCGTNYTGGGASPTGIAGTPGTAIAVTRTTVHASPTPIVTATGPTRGKVTLQLNAVPQQSSDPIVLTLYNQTNQTILFSDHLTECTVILLQVESQSIGGTWQAVAPCRLMTVTRLLSLASGKTLTIKLIPPGGQWATGMYRALLSYILPGANQKLQTALTPNFQVGK